MHPLNSIWSWCGSYSIWPSRSHSLVQPFLETGGDKHIPIFFLSLIFGKYPLLLCPQYNQQLLVSTEQWGRDWQISLDTQFCYHHNVQKENVLYVFFVLFSISFSFYFAVYYFKSKLWMIFLDFLVLASGHEHCGEGKKLWEPKRQQHLSANKQP